MLQQVLVGSSCDVRLDVTLQATPLTTGEVEVVHRHKSYEVGNAMSTVSARSVSMGEMSRYAGSLNDPARTVTGLAGVSFSKVQDNGVVVQGNAPRSVLWRLEGVEIPTPAHFGGGNLTGGGFISVFSTSLLSTWDFYTGAFPAEFGNGTSAVFDTQFRTGNAKERKYTLQAGVLGLEATAEGPLKLGGAGTFLASYRLSLYASPNRAPVVSRERRNFPYLTTEK